MKKLKLFGKLLAAVALSCSLLISATSCKGLNDLISGENGSPFDQLLKQLTLGSYTGTLSDVTFQPSNKCVVINWTNPTDEEFEGVRIYKDKETTPVFDGDASETSATIGNLVNGQTYNFSLFPKGREDDGTIKDGKNPTYKTITLDKQSVDKTYVGKISNLKYECGDGTVSFEWTNPTDDNFTSVIIYQGEEIYDTVEAPNNKITVEALENGKTYSFKFVARGKNAEGVEVDSLNFVLKRLKLEEVNEVDYFGLLENVTFTVNVDSVTFTWDNPTDEAFAGVAIYRGDSKVDDIDKTKNFYIVSNLENGDYTFKLVARGMNKKGIIVDTLNPWTKTVSINNNTNYIGKISNLYYTPGNASVTFSWTNPTDENFTGVIIYQNDEVYATIDAPENTITIDTLDNGTTYSFKFVARGKNKEGVEVDSQNFIQQRVKLDEVNETDYFGELSNVKFTTTEDSVTFTWDNPTDDAFAGVAIYRSNLFVDNLDKTENTYTIRALEAGDYNIKLVARGKNKKGVIVESLNPWSKIVTIIQLIKYGYIGRGYDAVNGEFFCGGEALKDPVIEFNESFIPKLDERPIDATSSFAIDTSIKEFQKKFNVSVGVEGGYAGFSGSVEVGFGKDEQFSEETVFASGTSLFRYAREYIENADKTKDTIKAHLTNNFKSIINDTSYTPEKIFEIFGTHIMLDTYIGGRFLLTYQYTNSSSKTIESIEAAVKASYQGAFSAGVNAEFSQEAKEMFNSSQTRISGKAYGGNGVTFGSLDSAVAAWNKWSDEIKDPATWSLVDSQNTISLEDEVTGIWLYADDPARQAEIRNKYHKLLEKNASSLAARQTHRWVKKVTVYDNGPQGIFKDMRTAVRNKLGTNADFVIVGEDAACGADTAKCDLNSGTGDGHNYCYLVVEYTTNKDEALRGVIGNSSESAAETETITLRNPQVDASQWKKMDCFNRSDGANYRHGTVQKNFWGNPKDGSWVDDGYRVIFNSWTQNREGTVGDKAYPIKEVAIWNPNRSYSSASTKALNLWTYNGDGNDITTATGGDDIHLRLYYDPNDTK